MTVQLTYKHMVELCNGRPDMLTLDFLDRVNAKIPSLFDRDLVGSNYLLLTMYREMERLALQSGATFNLCLVELAANHLPSKLMRCSMMIEQEMMKVV